MAAAPSAVSVKTAAVETRRLDRSISVTGSLEPDEMVALSSEVAGRVQAIYFDFGQAVRKGQVVVQLDKREYEFQLERAQSALAQARARLGIDPSSNAMPTETPATRQAAAQLEDARFKYQSATSLVKSGDISQERFTELEKAFHAREAAFEATRDEVRTQWASIRALDADVKLARKRIGDTTLSAPFDGAISVKNVSPGQYTKENTTIITLVKTSPLRLRAELPEVAAGNVRVGTKLNFTTDAAPGIQFEAVVRQLNPSLDTKSRTLTVEARMTSNDPRLRPGMFVQVGLITQPNTEIMVVPEDAIFRLAGISKVFVVRNGQVQEVRVPPGTTLDGWVEVPADKLRPGDSVATSNQAQLVDGTKVDVNKVEANKTEVKRS